MATATVYETFNDKVSIQAILDSNFTTGDDVVIVPKGSNFVNILIYNNT